MTERNAPGKMIIIVAPSGSGKSTLIQRLKHDHPTLQESVSYTTRPARKGERHGEHYFFVPEAEFRQKIDRGDFLEWAKVHSNYYGTEKAFVERKLLEGAELLFDLDVQGTDSFKRHFGERARAIFIAPPSVQELEKRLRGRGTDQEEVILERLENAKRELLKKDEYDYCVVNDDLERAYVALDSVVRQILGKS